MASDFAHPTQEVCSRSAIPAESDLGQDACAKPLGGSRHRLAGKRAVEAYGRLVVRERPDHQALQPALRQVAPGRGEQLAAKAKPLKLRTQIKLVDFAIVIEAACAVAAIIGVARDALSESEHGDPAAFANRAVPP